MRALVLVDLQYDFLPGGALAVPHGDDVLAVAKRVMPRFETIVATQDWHPAEHESFAVNHRGKHPGEVIDLHGMPQVLWPAHCVQGSRGAELHDDLDRMRIAHTFRKGTDRAIDSYSGFADNGHRKSTGLAEWLRKRMVAQLYVLGLATDYCVKATVIDACELGFDVWVVEDGCRPVELAPGDGDKAFADMRRAGATIIPSGAIGS